MLKSVAAQKLFPIGIAGSLAILSLLSIWKIPQWQIQPIQQQIDALQTSKQPVDPKKIAALEKSKLDAENAARTVLVQGAGGLFAAAAAYIAWRNLKATQEKQVAERFSKAVEQLGSDNIHTRLGGIYALEQIAKDAEEKYYRQVMETLTAYVRVRASIAVKSPSKPSFIQEVTQQIKTDRFNRGKQGYLEIDIQTVMNIIARRKFSYEHTLEPYRLDLSRVSLIGLQLPIGSQLIGIDFSESNLQGAFLVGVNLKNSFFLKSNLEGVALSKSNLEGAVLAWANLREAKLVNTNLRMSQLEAANLQLAYLVGSDLQEARLNEADLRGAVFQELNIDVAKLIGAKEAINLKLHQLKQTYSYQLAILPEYLLEKLKKI